MDENKVLKENENIPEENKRSIWWSLWKRIVWKSERHPTSFFWMALVYFYAFTLSIDSEGVHFGVFVTCIILGLIVKAVCIWLFHPEQLKLNYQDREIEQYRKYIQEQIEKENQKKDKTNN